MDANVDGSKEVFTRVEGDFDIPESFPGTTIAENHQIDTDGEFSTVEYSERFQLYFDDFVLFCFQITNATLLPLHVPLTEKNEWFLVHVRNLINNAQDVQLCHRIINVLHPDNDLQKCTHFETAVILCHQACVQKRVMVFGKQLFWTPTYGIPFYFSSSRIVTELQLFYKGSSEVG